MPRRLAIRYLAAVGLLTAPLILSSATSHVPVSDFSGGGLEDWLSRSFKGETRYEIVEADQRKAVSAHSRASASGLTRLIDVDLTQTPYLNWSWRVDTAPHGLAERTREGDDYAARVYVLDAGGFPLLPDRTLNYVWSGSQIAGSSWVSAYTDKVWMVAMRGPEDDRGVWHQEKRNVREDFRRLFGKEVNSIEGVAIMTDTDNSGQEARALYGEIYFTAE
ncbi:MAG: DUF3047 domain-containing protein [Chromatiales bacterium]|jgi:hypothetical protein